MKFSLVTAWEKQPIVAWTLSAVWVLGLCWLAFVWNLGSTGLVDETEPLFAEAARQMTVTGDWITPYFDGATRFDKPPLIYWLMAIAYQTIGVNEWAVRLPSALAAIALTIFGFFTLRYFGYTRPADHPPTADLPPAAAPPATLWLSALMGAALIALTPLTIVWARTGVSDMLLSGCMGSALLAFFWGYAQPPRSRAKVGWYLAFYILCALAVLTKGPVGVVIPGLVVVLFLLYVGKLREVLREMFPLRGLLLFLLIAVPWFVLVIQANGEAYVDSFFGYHNLERFTRVVNRHAAPWYFYFLVVFAGFIPYSIYLPLAIARLRFWQRRDWQKQSRATHLGLFALTWFGVIFGFFTIAVTKLPSYVLPLMPAAAILVALCWSDQMTRNWQGQGIQLTRVVNVLLFAGLSIALFHLTEWMGRDKATPLLPDAMSQSGVPVIAGVIWAIATLLGAILLLQRQGRWLWSVNLITFIAFITFAVMPAIHIMDAHRQLPLRQMAASIVELQKPNEPIIMVGLEKPSLVFYSHRSITFFPSAKPAYRRIQQISNRAKQPSSLLVLGISYRVRDLGLKPDQYEMVAEAGKYDMVRVKLPLAEQ